MDLGVSSLDEPLLLSEDPEPFHHESMVNVIRRRASQSVMSIVNGFRGRAEDPRPQLSFGVREVSVQEDHECVHITVCRDADSKQDACTISYQTADVASHTARHGFEYEAATGELKFEFGQESAKFSVRITDEQASYKRDCFKVCLLVAADETAVVGVTGECVVWILDRYTRRSLAHRIYTALSPKQPSAF